MTWILKNFKELTLEELYEILKLRQKVFVVGQECAYLDVDGVDQSCQHLFAFESNRCLAYLRIIPPGLRFKETAIGRVATDLDVRGKGLGREVMKRAMDHLRKTHQMPVRISAQAYLEKFYTDLGFKTVSGEYLEDDIPHIEMFAEK